MEKFENKKECKKLEITCKKTEEYVEMNYCITDSKTASEFARNFYHEDIELYESFFIILMNVGGKPIGWAKISQGGVTGVNVDPKIVAKYVIDTLATGIVLVHNHPSGSLKPSREDKRLTDRICEVMKLLDAKVFDHIIITENDYYSFNDNGILC